MSLGNMLIVPIITLLERNRESGFAVVDLDCVYTSHIVIIQ